MIFTAQGSRPAARPAGQTPDLRLHLRVGAQGRTPQGGGAAGTRPFPLHRPFSRGSSFVRRERDGLCPGRIPIVAFGARALSWTVPPSQGRSACRIQSSAGASRPGCASRRSPRRPGRTGPAGPPVGRGRDAGAFERGAQCVRVADTAAVGAVPAAGAAGAVLLAPRRPPGRPHRGAGRRPGRGRRTGAVADATGKLTGHRRLLPHHGQDRGPGRAAVPLDRPVPRRAGRPVPHGQAEPPGSGAVSARGWPPVGR